MSTGECDCCGEWSSTIVRIWYLNYMETFACAECRGIDPADYDEPPENPKQYEHEEKLEKAMDRFFGNKP